VIVAAVYRRWGRTENAGVHQSDHKGVLGREIMTIGTKRTGRFMSSADDLSLGDAEEDGAPESVSEVHFEENRMQPTSS